ncbi:MAG: DUF2490 domain-containing protein, partial [Cyanobacteria bacterium]|nr:DUF2490 domain-containing protein [Cyanobacteriota bacterium]
LHGLLGYSRVNIYAGPNQHQDSAFLEISRPWERHGFMINNSFRIEEIFFSNEAAPLTRGWHRIELAHELGHRHLRLLVSNELRYNFTGSHSGPAAGFHEDRLFVGLGRCINLHACGRVGYMLRTQFSENGSPTRFNHLLFVGMTFNATGPAHHNYTRGFPPGSI